MSIHYKFKKDLFERLKHGDTSKDAFVATLDETERLSQIIANEAIDPIERPIIIGACKLTIAAIESATLKVEGEESLNALKALTDSILNMHGVRGKAKEEEKK